MHSQRPHKVRREERESSDLLHQIGEKGEDMSGKGEKRRGKSLVSTGKREAGEE